MTPFTLNLRGRLAEYSRPVVMGVLNVTPDSFYSGSRAQTHADITRRARQLVADGADMLDIGAYSSGPGAACRPTKNSAASKPVCRPCAKP